MRSHPNVLIRVFEGLGKRLMVKPEFHAVQAPLQTRFVAKHELALPKAWAIVGDFPLVAQIVAAHGIEVWALKDAMRVPAEAFAVTELSRQRAAFQGHRLVTLGGKLAPGERELPAGTLIVSASHRLARLAAQLLEANSDDGLATWGYFDQAIKRADEAGADNLSYPVLRLDAMPEPSALRAVERDGGAFPRLVPYLPYLVLHNGEIERPAANPMAPSPGGAVLALEVAAPGERTPPRGFESEPRFTGRKLRFKLDDTEVESLVAVEAKIRDSKLAQAHKPHVVVVSGPGVSHREIVEACEAVRRTGVTQVFLFHAPR